MKKIITILLCATVTGALLSGSALAASKRPDEAFTISEYNVQAAISDKNVYDITETITVNYNEPRHGIYRNIPLSGTSSRLDSSGQTITNTYIASISDISVEGFEFTAGMSGEYEVIKIGSADKMVDGKQVYKISYKLSYYDDGLPDFDEVYYNIIGTSWDTRIDHAAFSITLPAQFDADVPGFSMGAQGVSGYKPDELRYSVEGNTVSGETLRALNANEGLTMYLKLPQGYFTTDMGFDPQQNAGSTDPTVKIFLAIAVIALTVFVVTPPGFIR